MTDALRPGELFALRGRSFDGSKLTITETVIPAVILSERRGNRIGYRMVDAQTTYFCNHLT